MSHKVIQVDFCNTIIKPPPSRHPMLRLVHKKIKDDAYDDDNDDGNDNDVCDGKFEDKIL